LRSTPVLILQRSLKSSEKIVNSDVQKKPKSCKWSTGFEIVSTEPGANWDPQAGSLLGVVIATALKQQFDQPTALFQR
jgi:hypothetical protein